MTSSFTGKEPAKFNLVPRVFFPWEEAGASRPDSRDWRKPKKRNKSVSYIIIALGVSPPPLFFTGNFLFEVL